MRRLYYTLGACLIGWILIWLTLMGGLRRVFRWWPLMLILLILFIAFATYMAIKKASENARKQAEPPIAEKRPRRPRNPKPKNQ